MQIPLTLSDPGVELTGPWPLTTGVPVPQGQLGSVDQVRVMGPGGEVPAQVDLAGRWPDGSVRWLLVSWIAEPEAQDHSGYRLECGRDVRRSSVDRPVQAHIGQGTAQLSTGVMDLEIDAIGNLLQVTRGDRQFLAVDKQAETVIAERAGDGKTVRLRPVRDRVEMELEEQGPIRAVLLVRTPYADAAGQVGYELEQRMMVWRGLPLVQLQHTVTVVRGEPFCALQELTLRVPFAQQAVWQVPLADGSSEPLGTLSRLLQVFDKRYMATGPDPHAGRIIGAAVMPRSDGVAVAVRDFWQNYPKALCTGEDDLRIELFPAFDAQPYADLPFEKQGHQLGFYLRDGCYRLKPGVAKTHELLFSFESDVAQRARQCQLFQDPPVATAPPAWLLRQQDVL